MFYGNQGKNIFWFASVFVNVLANSTCLQNFEYNKYKQTVSHRYESSRDPVIAMGGKNFFRICHICKVGYVCEYAFLVQTEKYSLWHKIYMQNFWQFDLYNVIVGVWHGQIG